MEIWELYRIAQEFPIQFIKIGNWSQSVGLQMTSLHKWQRRKNLNGHHFKITALPERPYIFDIKINNMTKKYEIKGSLGDLLELFKKTLNFTYTIEPPPDNKWGLLLENGSWNGMVNLVHKEVFDIGKCTKVTETVLYWDYGFGRKTFNCGFLFFVGFASFTHTRQRENAVTFGIAFDYGSKGLFIKNPTSAYNFTAYFQPLTYLCWIFVLIFILLLPNFMFMISNFSQDDSCISIKSCFQIMWLNMVQMPTSFNASNFSTLIIFSRYLI